jgi:hypothetical protein
MNTTDQETADQEREAVQKNSTMLYVDGSKTAFHCEVCRANVFTKLGPGEYRCNGCGMYYSEE